jgi:hypothetical protein
LPALDVDVAARLAEEGGEAAPSDVGIHSTDELEPG